MVTVTQDTTSCLVSRPAVWLPLVIAMGCLPRQAVAQNEGEISFSRDVLPVLSNKCFVCHGPDARDPDQLRLDSFAGATADRGGYRAIDPKQPGQSALLARISSEDDPMPPEEARPLTPEERSVLTRWVRQGGEYTRHWAFVPPRRISLPGVPTAEMIDTLIRRRLDQAGHDLATEATREILARRASLVLTGLPPEPEQLRRYLADNSPGSYERLVDDLLASSRFGEHQARYWLDAVRYGDTHGLHLDNRRGIYPYRDWVVRAFNQNLPLDDFLTWQIAGDLLPNPTLAQEVATGFVRMNPTTAEGGAIPAEFQAKNNFDRVETFGTVLLGMTLTCARCHSHKYDPISQQEYYRLLAFFNSTAEKSMDGNSYTYGPVVKAPSDQTGWENWEALETERSALLHAADRAVKGQSQDPVRTNWSVSSPAKRLEMLGAKDGTLSALPQHAAAATLLERIRVAEEAFTTTLVARDLENRRPTHVLQRGEYNLPTGEPLTPGTPAVMGSLPDRASSDRRDLAEWVTSPGHPLVARVLVNRIWQRTFGSGLVRTPEDFGLQGQQPTHPQLLDWLAVELRESGWDLKHMLRLMVTSRAFRQSSARRPGVDDPENKLVSRGPRHRLDAEVLRDIGLWSSGLLDPHMGGEGVKPYQPAGMWLAMAHPASNTKKYVADTGERLYRRSLYVYWKRTSPHPMMTIFDAPDRESSCVRRSRTNTTLQSLGLLNEPQRIEIGRRLAARLLETADDDDGRLGMLFELLACRAPTPRETSACLVLLNKMRARYGDSEPAALSLLTTGAAPRKPVGPPAEHAAWCQVAITVLASDVAIMLY